MDSHGEMSDVKIHEMDKTSVFKAFPLHCVHLSSSVLSGSVVVGLRSSLPFKGVQLLLGNDLAGDKVVNPANTNVPALDQPYNPLEKVFCLLSPSCIINQTMDKKVFH